MANCGGNSGIAANGSETGNGGEKPQRCACEAEDVRVAEVTFPGPQPPGGRRKLTLAVKVVSKCETKKVPDLFSSLSPGAFFESVSSAPLVEEAIASSSVLDIPGDFEVFIRRPFNEALAAPPLNLCKVTYRIANSAASNFNITEFQVGGDQFTFPAPSAPGNAEQVEIAASSRNCERRKSGLVKGVVVGGAAPIQIESIDVCVLV